MTAVVVHGQRDHSELGASGMSRWSKCPASVALVRGLGNKAGHAAERGTAVHEVAERMLRRRLLLDLNQVLYGFRDDHPLSHYIGNVANDIEIDGELAETARDYVNECLKILQPGDRVWIERQFTLDALAPDLDMYGTAELVAYRGGEQLLIVIDLKSGAGIVVQARNNPQLRYYALGAALSLPGLAISTIGMVIVQPRVPDPVKRDTIDSLELLEWSADLLDAARATQAGDAPAVAGDHCRFCPARQACITYELAALEAARDDFDVIEGTGITVSMPDPAELSAEDLARRLGLVPMLRDWIKTMEAMAFQRLQRKDAVPGWKLVAKQSRRKWRDEEDALDWMLAHGLTRRDAVKSELISPAQAEKLVADKTGMADLVTTESSGLTLVPDTDRRPAVAGISAQDDFDLIDDDDN
jgi:Protein of unknown function (DUF2800)